MKWQLTIMTVAMVFTTIQNMSFALARGSAVTWSFVIVFGNNPSAAAFSRSVLLLFSSISVSDMLSRVLSELPDPLRGRDTSRLFFRSSFVYRNFSASAFRASMSDSCRACSSACVILVLCVVVEEGKNFGGKTKGK